MTERKEIYLDNSATTKISEEALNKYDEISRNIYGNPSSLHALGFSAERELSEARKAVLDSILAKDARVIFTASGTEANNLAIFGRAFAKERFKRGAKIITTKGEHASVSSPISILRNMGFKVEEIKTDGGELDMDALKNALTPDVILVSMMMVNNETGALYDTGAVSKLMKTRSPEALLHVDATQSYMKVPFTKMSSGADMITVSSHKIRGPKGVGALIIDEKIVKTKGITPLTLGGGQEAGFRSGTENVPAIAAFGEAVRIAKKELQSSFEHISSLREYLIEKLSTSLPEIGLILPKNHAPHILNIILPGIRSETMLHYLSSLGIYVSSGSACSSNSHAKSSALISFGKSENDADSSIRISFCAQNTVSDVDALCEGLESGIKKLARKR